VIEAPIKAVYQTLVNVDKRPEWLDGVYTIDREMTSERINVRHNDQHSRLPRFFRRTRTLIGEGGYPRNRLDAAGSLRDETGRRRQHATELQRQLDGRNLPADKKKGMMAGQAANFALFKKVCEANPA
jgi:hypothetical protein